MNLTMLPIGSVLCSLTLGFAICSTGCLKKSALFCDENTPCTDPDRPFCDLTGEFPDSEGIGKTSSGFEEPALFSEPGLFLVRPDGTIYFGSVQTMPFARPAFAEILGATKFVLEKGYPARGEVVDHTSAQAAE